MKQHLLQLLKEFQAKGEYGGYTCDFIYREGDMVEPDTTLGYELSKLNSNRCRVWCLAEAEKQGVTVETNTKRFRQFPLNVLACCLLNIQDDGVAICALTGKHEAVQKLRKQFVAETIEHLEKELS